MISWTICGNGFLKGYVEYKGRGCYAYGRTAERVRARLADIIRSIDRTCEG